MDLADIARGVITSNNYLALGTADAAGTPWVSPVYYTPDGYADFYWVSSPETRHSRNIAVRPDVSIAIYDSQAPIGAAEAVYMTATAAAVPPEKLDRLAGVFNARLPEQKRIAEQSKATLDQSHRFSSPIAVKVEDAGAFTAAEDYHQNFHTNNEAYYKRYRVGCRRDARLKEIWGADADTAGH